MTSHNQVFNPPDHPSFAPTFSQISRVSISDSVDLISFAGQIGADADRNIPDTLIDQVKIAFANVDRCLQAVGAVKTDIIQVRQYVVNLLPVNTKRAELYSEVSSF